MNCNKLELNKLLIPYYKGGITEVRPKGTVTLDKFVTAIRSPTYKMELILKNIRAAAKVGDHKRKNELKKQLPFFTPAVLCSYRNYDNIQGFTGLAPFDFDNKDMSCEFAVELKNELFKTYNFVIASWLSSSGKGVRVLVKIPQATSVMEFKSYYKSLEHKVMGQIKGYDKAPQNPVLPLYLSVDRELLYRQNPEIWREKYIPPPPPPPPPRKWVIYGDKASEVERIIKSSVEKNIPTSGPAFMKLRGISYLAGGYVGGGYIGEKQAIDLIIHIIRCHPYMSQTPKYYEAPAIEMVKRGKGQPVKL